MIEHVPGSPDNGHVAHYRSKHYVAVVSYTARYGRDEWWKAPANQAARQCPVKRVWEVDVREIPPDGRVTPGVIYHGKVVGCKDFKTEKEARVRAQKVLQNLEGKRS